MRRRRAPQSFYRPISTRKSSLSSRLKLSSACTGKWSIAKASQSQTPASRSFGIIVGPASEFAVCSGWGSKDLGREPPTLNKVLAVADGGFKTPALWPDENYRLIASAPGHVSLESAVVYGPAGEVTAVEPFVLSRNDMNLKAESSIRMAARWKARRSSTPAMPTNAWSRPPAADRATPRWKDFTTALHLLARLSGYRAAGWLGAAGGEPIEIALSPSNQPPRQSRSPKATEAPDSPPTSFRSAVAATFGRCANGSTDNPP